MLERNHKITEGLWTATDRPTRAETVGTPNSRQKFSGNPKPITRR